MNTTFHKSRFLLTGLSVALVVSLIFFVYTRFGKGDVLVRQDDVAQSSVPQRTDDSGFVTLSIGSAVVHAEIARTTEQRVRGLSGRGSLGDDEGMLFVFPVPDTYGIWMPDMHFPIDIIWLDEAMQVVDIKENATPESYPETFRPRRPASYVLEVSSGYTKENGIYIGTQGTTVRE